jgi:chromosomal replication initiator protein DnaA
MDGIKGASKKLGELLIREDIITRAQLEEALKEKEISGQFLGEILMRAGYVSEDELIGFLVRQCRIPHLKLSNFQISSEIAHLVPAEICRDHKLLPIDKLGSLLTVAMVNPIDVEALEKVKNTVNLRIKPILCSWGDFKKLFDRIYADTKPPKMMEGYEEDEGPEPARKAQVREDEPPSESPEPPEETVAAEPEQSTKERKEVPRDNGLIERFTFENFVVAEANSFTYALARSVAEDPGAEYNPLFVYGNTGRGKTHLSNAIGNEIMRNNSGTTLVYAAASRFVDEMLEAIENEKLKEFREHFSDVDALILDDVHFLAGRTRAQEEFFHIFNAIHTKKKQIILVSDVPPKDLQGLEERLISRFEGGVVACLEEPDFPTRQTILRQRIEAAGVEVADDVVDLLANSIHSNVRELEGALKKLLAYSSLVGHEITVELAQEVLKHLIKSVDARN